jgi:multidrug resistance efflux pump
MTNDTFVRQVQVQINFTNNQIADIRPGDYMQVSASPYDATLTKFVYVVRSVINSSNPWQRTLICEVDMESDPNA